MVEWADRALFAERFIACVKSAREEYFSKAEMATLLGLPLDIYEQYETYSLLPHHLIWRFCLVTGLDLDVLFGESSTTRGTGGNGGRKQ